MQLNPIMDKFYNSILNYAGMELKDNVIVNTNEKLGDITIEGKHLTLPYFENLKNPDGKVIVHLLNENYTSPENSVFTLYKRRLELEVNLKLSSLIVTLISVASDPQLQSKIKSSKLIELIGSLGEIDNSLIESFLGLVKASSKQNDTGYILSVFLKKNGEIKDVPYAAIGKINFHLYTEIVKALEDKSLEYRVYGHKMRKKDLLALRDIFNVIFPSIEGKTVYSEGTDNKIFRYLNILLKTTYIVTARINEIAQMLEMELKQGDKDATFCHDWVDCLEPLYGMSSEIRLIPNQIDLSLESNKLHVDESKAKNVSPAIPQQQQPMQFDPQRAQQVQQPAPQQHQPNYPQQQPYQPVQPQQPPQPLTAEDIIRGNMVGSPMPMQPMPAYMPQQPAMPQWMQLELMKNNPQQFQQMQQMPPGYPQQPMMPMQQPMMPQMPYQPGMPYQPNMQQPYPPQYPQGQYPQQGMMTQPVQQPSGLQVNPHFLTRAPQAPWQ